MIIKEGIVRKNVFFLVYLKGLILLVLKLLSSHTSIRTYKNKQLPKEEVFELIATAQHAASSNFVQAYSVIWITDDLIKKKLGQYSQNPTQMETAGAVLVCCVDFQRLHFAGLINDTPIVTDTTA